MTLRSLRTLWKIKQPLRALSNQHASTNSSLPDAWITGPATDPSYLITVKFWNLNNKRIWSARGCVEWSVTFRTDRNYHLLACPMQPGVTSNTLLHRAPLPSTGDPTKDPPKGILSGILDWDFRGFWRVGSSLWWFDGCFQGSCQPATNWTRRGHIDTNRQPIG